MSKTPSSKPSDVINEISFTSVFEVSNDHRRLNAAVAIMRSIEKLFRDPASKKIPSMANIVVLGITENRRAHLLPDRLVMVRKEP